MILDDRYPTAGEGLSHTWKEKKRRVRTREAAPRKEASVCTEVTQPAFGTGCHTK